MVAMQGVEPWSNPEKKRDPGDLIGILFQVISISWNVVDIFRMNWSQNITIAAPSVLGEPEVLWGMSDGLIYDLVFDNVTIGGEKIESLDQFYYNEFVLPLVIP